jgi:hypothetical protein
MAISYGVNPDWAATTSAGREHISTKGIIQDGLVFNIDAGVLSSYPESGTTFTDLKANHNISLFNGPTYSSLYGGSIVFDGVNDFGAVSGGIPLASPISLTNNFTIEQVFRPTAYQVSTYFGLTNMLLNKGTASTYNYATQVTSNTSFSFIKRGSTESLQYNNFTVPSMLNTINIVTLVIENGNNTSIDTVSCYYNGTFIATQSIAGTAIAAVNNDPLYLGGLSSQQYTNFTGSYYAGRIYNRALTASEITRNFNSLTRRYVL